MDLSLLGFLGIGGVLGALLSVIVMGQQVSDRIRALREELERAAKRPESVDFNRIVQRMRAIEEDFRGLLQALQRLVGRR